MFYLPQAAMVAILMIFSYLFLSENRGRVKEKIRKLLRQGWVIGFLGFAAFMLTSMVIARPKTNPYHLAFSHFFFGKNARVNWFLVENMLVFAVYILLYLLAFRPGKPWRAALSLSCCTTMFIEVCQLLFWLGSFQFSDMLYNVIGGMIGCGVWVGIRRLRKR